MRTLPSIVILLLITLTSIAQNHTSSEYKIIARLGDGKIGNAVFSPDSNHLAIASTGGTEIYNLNNDGVRKLDSNKENHPINIPSIFVTYTADSQSLIYIEPINFRINSESIYSQIESIRVWKVDTDNFTSATLVNTIDVSDINLAQIEYLSETNELVLAFIIFDANGRVQTIRNYVILDITSGKIREPAVDTVTISAFSILREYQTPRNNYSIDSPDSKWQFSHMQRDEGYLLEWYEIVEVTDKSILTTNFDAINSISIMAWNMSYSGETEITFVEDPRCGTGIKWDWLEDTIEILEGYGGCGESYMCLDLIGDNNQYCVSPQPTDNYETIAVFYDWYYLEQNPNISNPDYIYERTEHTDQIIYFRALSSNTIVSGSQDKTAIIWNVEIADESVDMTIRLRLEHPAPVTYIGYNPKNSDEIMTASGNNLYFWDDDTGILKYMLTGHMMPIVRVAVRGHSFASYSSDGVVLVWDAID